MRDSSGCRALRVDDVEARPWVRVSWTMETEEDPCVCFRVVGTDAGDGMNFNSLDCANYISFLFGSGSIP